MKALLPAPLANWWQVLPVVGEPCRFHDAGSGAALDKTVLRDLHGSSDERFLALLQVVESLTAALSGRRISEPRVPGIRVVVADAFRHGTFTAGDALKGLGHLPVPASDVDQDLADTPRTEPGSRHLFFGHVLNS